VDPLRPGTSLRRSRWTAMWEDLVALMEDGVREGVIRTVRPEHLTDDEREEDGRVSYVYRRTGEPCRVCGARVRTRDLQGRNLYWCGQCQPRFRSRALQ
jgi:endonuclease-8